MDSYKTCAKEAQSEFCEKKSIFTSYIFPIPDFEEAMKKLEEIKMKTADANHHVWAFINKEGNTVRFSDDGEPKGTAGMPVLEVLKKEELFGVLVIVVRYFGGILLGAGGLTRAYARGARDAVTASGITEFYLNDLYSVNIPYPKLAIAEREIMQRKIIIKSKSFEGDGVAFKLLSTGDIRNAFDAFLSDMTSGKLSTEFIGNEFAPKI